MTDAGYSILSVFKSKLFFIIGFCLAAIVFVTRILTVPTYLHSDIVSEVYPVQMVSTETSQSSINPCYKMRRILGSEDFKRKMTAASQNMLSEDIFSRCYKFYETPQHTMFLHLYVDDTVAGLRLMSYAVALLKRTFDEYPSSILENASEGNLVEAKVPDYHWDEINTVFVTDIVDQPYVASSPKAHRFVVTLLLSIVFSFCIAAAFCLLISNLKNRKDESCRE